MDVRVWTVDVDEELQGIEEATRRWGHRRSRGRGTGGRGGGSEGEEQVSVVREGMIGGRRGMGSRTPPSAIKPWIH
jgi:hypothetical protein